MARSKCSPARPNSPACARTSARFTRASARLGSTWRAFSKASRAAFVSMNRLSTIPNVLYALAESGCRRTASSSCSIDSLRFPCRDSVVPRRIRASTFPGSAAATSCNTTAASLSSPFASKARAFSIDGCSAAARLAKSNAKSTFNVGLIRIACGLAWQRESSEDQLHGKLDLPRVRHGARDTPLCRVADPGVRHTEVLDIEDVEELPAELKIQPLTNPKVFEKRKVHVIHQRRPERVPP